MRISKLLWGRKNCIFNAVITGKITRLKSRKFRKIDSQNSTNNNFIDNRPCINLYYRQTQRFYSVSQKYSPPGIGFASLGKK